MPCLLLCAAALLTRTSEARYFKTEQLAPGVYAFIRTEPPGLAVDCNVTAIINDKDVVLVDANIGPESAKETIKALKQITLKPVSAIICTHYHGDHSGGLATWRKAYPKLEVIAHESFVNAMDQYEKKSRASMITGAPQMAKFLRDQMAKGQNITGKPIDEETRTSYLSDIRIAERYGREMPSVELVSPTKLVKDRLTLNRGKRTIEIRHLGPGHTISDLVVWLPKERIAIAGDLLVYPVPLVGAPQSRIQDWPKTLDKLAALKPTVTIPGHGPALRDTKYLELMQRFFREVWTSVKDRIAKGEALDQIRKDLKLPELKQEFCGDSHVKAVLFESYARRPAIEEAYRELTTERLP